ncbi:MAG: glycosyltransferase family 4 protein [Acidimicrobiales bacterium]
MSAGPILCDLRAIQSPDHRGRGIGRWAYECAAALERVRPDLVSAYLLDPDWPPPGRADELVSTGKLAYLGTSQATRALEEARVYHCLSPFELALPISAVRPSFVDERGIAYSTVAYDLIPLRHPEEYLVHPAQRRRYVARLELLRNADAVLAISTMAATDLRELLGMEEGRCHVIGTGVSRHFVPPTRRSEALHSVRASIEALGGPFVLYPGGNDGRKNIDGLIAAFGRLPVRLRDHYNLVVVGDIPPLTANHYRHLAGLAGIEKRLVLTGYVSDDQLIELYQAADLFIFPSLAEGYGLPIAEALACGAVAAVSDRPPFDELVPDRRARFDPTDPDDIAATLERCLTDQKLRKILVRSAAKAVVSWDVVAERAAAVLDQLACREPRPWRSRRRIAVVAPFPPLATGVAGYTAKLVEAMRRAGATRAEPGSVPIEIDCYADGLDRYPVELQPVDGVVPADARTQTRHRAPTTMSSTRSATPSTTRALSQRFATGQGSSSATTLA